MQDSLGNMSRQWKLMFKCQRNVLLYFDAGSGASQAGLELMSVEVAFEPLFLDL